MSERLPIVDNLCKNPENHSAHLCELKQAKNEEKIAKLTENPKYVCGNCGNTANQEGALCAPGPIDA